MSVSRGSHNLDALIVSAARGLVDDTAEYMLSVDTSETMISKRTDKKVNRTIRKHSRDESWNSIPIIFRKAVAVIMVFCTISFAACMSVQAVRKEVWNIVLEWYDKFVAVFYVTDETPPSIIEEFREPTLQLAGTKRIVITQAETINQIHYMNGEDLSIIYQQMVITNGSSDFDSEHECVQQEIKINEYDGNLFLYDNDVKVITWHDTQYVYTIIAYPDTVEVDILLSLAESVK